MSSLLSVFALLFFVSFFSVTKQEIFQNRRCADYNVEPITGFRKRPYGGKWYVYRLNDYEASLDQDCLLWDYLTITSKNAHSIETSVNLETGEPRTIDSTMYFDKKGTGQFTYDVPADDEGYEYVKVIETDFKTYSVEWSCVDNEEANECENFVYLMTRDRVPNKATIAAMERVCSEHNIDLTKTRLVVQDSPVCSTIN